MIGKTGWAIVAIICAWALATVVGFINPTEKVNALWIVIAASCFYAISYRFYSAFIAAKVLSINDKRTTPALRLNNGTDFDPTNRWVLFGHHFAAIAGAGPLIGPMLAAQFGYLPGFLWILIGSAFAGSVHDMVILEVSVRRNGKSLAQIVREEIWPMFGVSNQLLAAIALGMGTTLIIKYQKEKYVWVTLIPMIFMFVTTLTAAWQLMQSFNLKAAASTNPVESFNFSLDAVLVIIMGVLAIISLTDMLYKWYGLLTGRRKIVLNEFCESEI